MTVDTNLADRLAVSALQIQLNEMKLAANEAALAWVAFEWEAANDSIRDETYNLMVKAMDKLGALTNA